MGIDTDDVKVEYPAAVRLRLHGGTVVLLVVKASSSGPTVLMHLTFCANSLPNISKTHPISRNLWSVSEARSHGRMLLDAGSHVQFTRVSDAWSWSDRSF